VDYVHRVAYELAKGPIPAGMQIDHLCRVLTCCNPAHLEAVTPRTNVRRSNSTAGINARKTHCSRGHPLDLASDNCRYSEKYNTRFCRACERLRGQCR
jgi:hypothetical protein